MAQQRGTTNRNARGSSYDRAGRRAFLLVKFGDGKTAPCYRCGALLSDGMLTVDRIVPGVEGGRYTRDNIRPACGPCNSETGGQMATRRGRQAPTTTCVECGCQCIADSVFRELPTEIRGQHKRRCARGLCQACYTRARRAGNLADYPRPSRTNTELLEEYTLLRTAGLTRREIASRLHISVVALDRAVTRARRTAAGVAA